MQKVPGAILDLRTSNVRGEWSIQEEKMIIHLSAFFEFASPSVQRNFGSVISEFDDPNKIANEVFETIQNEGIEIAPDGFAYCGDYTLDFN
jgi:hypothetical protein